MRRVLIGWGGRTRTSEMPGPKPGALPLGDTPTVTQLSYYINGFCQDLIKTVLKKRGINPALVYKERD